GFGRTGLVVVVREPVAVAVPDVTDVDHAVAVLVRDRIADVQGRRRIGATGWIDRVLVDEPAVLGRQPELVATTHMLATVAGSPAASLTHVDEVRTHPLAPPRLDRALGVRPDVARVGVVGERGDIGRAVAAVHLAGGEIAAARVAQLDALVGELRRYELVEHA